MNDPADDINFDAAFVKDSDISGAREALGKFLQELESIGIMSMSGVIAGFRCLETLPVLLSVSLLSLTLSMVEESERYI